jgi:hypothetical protein
LHRRCWLTSQVLFEQFERPQRMQGRAPGFEDGHVRESQVRDDLRQNAMNAVRGLSIRVRINDRGTGPEKLFAGHAGVGAYLRLGPFRPRELV